MTGVVEKKIGSEKMTFFFGPLTKYLYEKKTGHSWDAAVHNIAGLPYFHLVEIMVAAVNAYNRNNQINREIDEYDIIRLINDMGEKESSVAFVEVIKEGIIAPESLEKDQAVEK